jgi:DNA uptake protein ComE-like DNA-binding protein
VSNLLLRSGRAQAENDAVQARWKIMLLSALVFCAPPCGSAQNTPAATPGMPREHAAPSPEARVDINHASADELRKVPGMTQTWAARIVRFRPYRTKQDLLDKGVLPSEVYDRLKDFLIAHRDKP